MLKLNEMKTVKIILVLSLLICGQKIVYSQNNTLSGYAFLENQMVHDSIQIIIKRIAPTIQYDTIFTTSEGYYSNELSDGFYDFYFSKGGYLPESILSQAIFQNITLPNITLDIYGISGQLSGILTSGIYKVGGSISVAEDDTLIVQPGVILKFLEDTEFEINGLLIASGNVTDSIFFTTYYPGEKWNGIIINPGANDATIITYAKIENSDDKGIEIYEASPSLEHLTICNNTAPNENITGKGAGIYLFSSTLLLQNITFENNFTWYGSGFHSEQSTVIIQNCIFKDHITSNGACVYIEDNSFAEISNCIFFNTHKTNWTMPGPTAICCSYSEIIVRNSLFHHNDYGGINGYYSNVKVLNSVFCKNNAYGASVKDLYGTGISISHGEADIFNNILSDHAKFGLIISNVEPYNVYNNCSWNNNQFTNNTTGFIGIIVTVNNNGDSCDVYNNILLNPEFADTSDYKYNLSGNSPCIDGGNSDPIFNDVCFPPSLGTLINDMGAYGGPFACNWPLLNSTDFLSFSFPQETGPALIDYDSHSIQVEVAFGTELNGLTASFTLSDGATANVEGVNQQSGITPNDFTDPIIYEVIAQDGLTTQDWSVIVTVAPNSETDFLSFSFPEQTEPGFIDPIDHSIEIEVVHGTILDGLIASFDLSEGATANIEGINQQSGITPNDFTNPVTYEIIAEDELTAQDWSVIVTVAPNSETDLLSFSFPEQTEPGFIDPINHTIEIEVVNGTNLDGLIASFALSEGAAAYIEGINQQSGITPNDFTNPVTYEVIAEDGLTTQNWIIIVYISIGINSYEHNECNIYPNPFESFTRIEFLNSNLLNVHLSVIDHFGNIIFKNEYIQTTSIQFQGFNLPKGIYIIELTSKNLILRRKLIKK